jgi:hypothetical protein
VDREKWQEAMQDELDKMEKYEVWNVIDREDKVGVVGAKWVYMVYTRNINEVMGGQQATKQGG